MTDSIRALADEAERIHAEYRRHFAGRSRFTRELSRVDGLIEDTRRAIGRAEKTPGAEVELLPVLKQRLELYATERDAIAQLQAGGEDEAVAHRTGEWTRLLRRRYVRNFAGQNRLTRDLGLLRSMVADQKRWRDELRAAAARHQPGWHQEELELMDANIELFDGEATRVEESLAALEPLRLAQVMATQANGQFDGWRLHFQGRNRRGRRPALLRRMIGNLERIHAGMVSARDRGVREDFNQGNIDNVAGRIAAWKEELRKIEQTRAQVGPDELAGILGEEANAWFSEYRRDHAGKPRASIDLAGLSRVCEALFEVGLAMEDQHLTWRRELNARNLLIVIENLKGYEREVERVREAQQPSA